MISLILLCLIGFFVWRLIANERNQENRIEVEKYAKRFLDNTYNAHITDVINLIESFSSSALRYWQLGDRIVNNVTGSVYLRFDHRCQETFYLGQWGCRLEFLSWAIRMRRNLLSNECNTEAVTVPYEFLLSITVQTVDTNQITVQVKLDELIDPMNNCNYIRNGHIKAPSILFERVGDIQGELHNYLRSNLS
jgi:hypothetical protein